MGPATFRHGGRIVSDTYRQFPDYVTHFAKSYSNNLNIAFTRRWYSNVALSSDTRKLEIGKPVSEFVPSCDKACTKYSDKISVAMKNDLPNGKVEKKSHYKKRDIKQLNMATIDQIVRKKLSKDIENRVVTMQKKVRGKLSNELRIVEKATTKIEKASGNEGKSKNWTIPAALSDKKPRMLYGLVRQRRKPLTSFFANFFNVQGNDTAEDYYNSNQLGGWKVEKLNCARNQRTPKELTDQNKVDEKAYEEGRPNASTSMGDLAGDLLKGEESAAIKDNSITLEETRNSISIEQPGENLKDLEERGTTSSYDESENDAISEASEPQRTMRRMSSKIALFLENLNINRQKSHSLSSLASYNLNTLFSDLEVAPVFNYSTPSLVLFSPKDTDSKSTIKDKLKKICGKQNKKKEDDICKKRSSCSKPKAAKCKRSEAPKSCDRKKESSTCKKREDERKSCSGDGDPCIPYRQHQGPPCKKYQDPFERGNHDPCKQYWREEFHGKQCKAGKTDDPCSQYWRDEIHGERCNQGESCDKTSKNKQKKKKSDTCGKKEKSSEAKQKEKLSCSKKGEKAEKTKCPPVIRAPGCSKDDKKPAGDSCRRYSTLASRITVDNAFDYSDIPNLDVLKDISTLVEFNRQEAIRNINPLRSNVFNTSRLLYG